MPKFAAVLAPICWTAAWNRLFSSVGQSTWFVISGSLVRIRQEAQNRRSDLYFVDKHQKRKHLGQIPEWPNGADCKSAVFRLRWFESIFAHHSKRCGSSSVDRALAFQAEGRGFEPRLPLFWCCCYSSVVEHFLGKEEVAGSTPANSSIFCI